MPPVTPALRPFALALLSLAVLLPMPGASAGGADPSEPGRWVALHARGDQAASAALQGEIVQAGGRVLLADDVLGFVAFAMNAPSLALLPHASALAPDAPVTPTLVPDDPQYPNQWVPPAIGLPDAWERTLGSHNVTVAIIDSGLAYTHPDIAANVCTLGPDYADGDMDPWNGAESSSGHGTLVAGALGAVVGNAVGIAGTANACLMPIRQNGWSSSVASALRWAVDHDARIVSMSFHFGSLVPTDVQAAVQYAADHGVLLVAAAGNDGCGATIPYPASDARVIAVGALATPNARSSFSECGADLELMAPGENIRTLNGPTGYTPASGTSLATPIVAGVAGLVLSADPTLSPEQVRQVLAGTATDLDELGRDARTGYGRVDAGLALRVARGEATPAPVGLVAERGPLPGQIRLSWQEPLVGGATGFNVYRGASPDALEFFATVAGTTFTDGGLAEGARFIYGVTATGPAGESHMAEVSQAAPERPSAPLHLRAAASPGAITLTWQPPAADGGIPASYRVYRGRFSGQETFLTLLPAGSTAFEDLTCPTAVTCHYLVSAVNAVAEGATSNEASPMGTVGPVSVYAFGESEADQVAVSLTHEASAPVAASGTGDADGGQAAASFGGDASGPHAVSWRGNATGEDAVSVRGSARGSRAASLFGNATGDIAGSLSGDATGDVAASALGDAEGSLAALSLRGDADGPVAVSGRGDANGSLAAVSAWGDSDDSVAASVWGDANGSLAALSVFGDARSATLPFSVFGECNGGDCLSAALGQDAEGETAAASVRGNSSAPVAASVFGDAHGTLVGASLFGDSQGAAALSGFGRSDGVAAASVLGDAHGSAAASLAGDADSSLASASVLGDASCDTSFLFCVAASMAGDAASCAGYPDCTAVSGLGDSDGSQAISGTGEARGWHERHSGCAALRETGVDAACGNPYLAARDEVCLASEANPWLAWMLRFICV